jgi:hypothetical protein
MTKPSPIRRNPWWRRAATWIGLSGAIVALIPIVREYFDQPAPLKRTWLKDKVDVKNELDEIKVVFDRIQPPPHRSEFFSAFKVRIAAIQLEPASRQHVSNFSTHCIAKMQQTSEQESYVDAYTCLDAAIKLPASSELVER